MVLTYGKENMTVASPDTTIKATKLVPRKSPKIYLMPGFSPYTAPTPAVERTPGPGVIIRKKTAKENISKL